MACNKVKRYCSALVDVTSAVYLNEQVVLCIPCLDRLPCTFHIYYNAGTVTGAASTSEVVVQNSAGGTIALVNQAGTAVTYADLYNGSVYNIAKINVCGTSYGGISYLQLINVIPTATATP